MGSVWQSGNGVEGGELGGWQTERGERRFAVAQVDDRDVWGQPVGRGGLRGGGGGGGRGGQ